MRHLFLILSLFFCVSIAGSASVVDISLSARDQSADGPSVGVVAVNRTTRTIRIHVPLLCRYSFVVTRAVTLPPTTKEGKAVSEGAASADMDEADCRSNDTDPAYSSDRVWIEIQPSARARWLERLPHNEKINWSTDDIALLFHIDSVRFDKVTANALPSTFNVRLDVKPLTKKGHRE